MTSKLIPILLTGVAVILLTGCGETSGVTVSKDADAAIETQNEAELEEIVTEAEQAGTDVNAPFNAFLSKYVVEKNGINLVAYGKVSDADEAELEAYIDTLSNTDISGFSDAEIQAYWFNLYNAKTVDLILDNYPTESIRNIKRPWKEKRLTVNGEAMSLDNIEHDTVREMYDEPRVHFAFNCASIGCPNLKMTAWEAETLDADLDQAARDYIASPRGISIDEDGDVDASEIFKWYKDDFGSNEKEMMTYLAQFADGTKKTALQSADKVDDWDYDWSLNVAR